MMTKKLFLASSAELKEDRKEFEIFINRKNKEWVARGVFLELVVWDDFLDAMSHTRLQDEYNRAIRECDVFLMLFWTKVGKYTREEFQVAFGRFQATDKPFIFTYFKDAEISSGSANKQDLMSLCAFQEKLCALGHFYSTYKNVDELKYQFNQQLDKLAASEFVEFERSAGEVAPRNEANHTGSGAIAQGSGAVAVGRGGVYIGGRSTGNTHTGIHVTGDMVRGDKVLESKTATRADTGSDTYVGCPVPAGGDFIEHDQVVAGGLAGHDSEALFAPLLAIVEQQALPDQKSEAIARVQQLRAETEKGEKAGDSELGDIIYGLVAKVPGAAGAVASIFAQPFLQGVTGPVTEFVLERLETQ